MTQSTSNRHGGALRKPTPEAVTPVPHLVSASGQVIEARMEAAAVTLSVDGQAVLRMARRPHAGDDLSLVLDSVDAHAYERLTLALSALFAVNRRLGAVEIALPSSLALIRQLARAGLVARLAAREDGVQARFERALWWQRSAHWLGADRSADFPLSYVMTGEKRHPLRPPRPEGVVYRRFIPELASVVSFRTIDPVGDLDPFHRWMNDPRVAAFWELSGTRAQHAEYLSRILSDPHTHPVIGLFDDQPFGYFELYWAKEDRIAPFYPVDDYDRGLHMLVGEARFRGPQRVSAWLSSLVHYLFLDDPRTRHVVAEPRADNQKMIDYLRQAGFYVQSEFDFPHKRAAMMIVPRATFFGQFGP